ncbi:MAG: 5-(carboxyamino)imidazole ribonucleotide synthase [Gammaproteobacteria bacterium]
MKIGILGAGQLGRMLGLAAIPLGIECRFLDRSPQAPAAALGGMRLAALDDLDAITELARTVDVLTPEIENVATEALEAASAHCKVAPPPGIVAAAQDRLREKQLLRSRSIPTARYHVLDSAADAAGLAASEDHPYLIKTRRLGYDGKGQRLAKTTQEAVYAFDVLGGVASIAEELVEFECEVSLIGVRAASGETAFYPLCENSHDGGILSCTIAPYEDERLQSQAETWLADLMEHTAYVGVLTVEFFVTSAGLIANEIAPRVHNSGHWTIEGAETSQFENHIRAIAGLPLGDTTPRGHSAMLNLIGTMPERATLLAAPGAHLHDYGKAPRPGRKLGHCTLLDRNRDRLLKRLEALKSLIS